MNENETEEKCDLLQRDVDHGHPPYERLSA